MSKDATKQLYCLPDCKPEKGATIITRRKSGEAFTIIRKSVLDDSRLSWQARGVLAYLLGKPDGWKVRVADLVNRGPSGETFVRSVLTELRGIGYAQLERLSGERGKVREWRWTISDEPEFRPDVVRPDVANRDYSKKDEYSGQNEGLEREPIHPASCDCIDCRSTLREPAAEYVVRAKP